MLATKNDIEFVYTFNAITYLVYLDITSKRLGITLESLNETNYWNGTWEPDEIEEITIKAKSHKTYQVFTKMISTALTRDSSIVKLELLSYADLQELKKQKVNTVEENFKFQDPTGENNLEVDPFKVKTKYLIIKYNTDFEVSQFPLRLHYLDKPTEVFTSRTITRLRSNQKSNDDLDQNSRKEFEELKTQITILKGKVRLLECNRSTGAVENEEYLSSIQKIKAEFEQYKIDSNNKIISLNKTLKETKHKMEKQAEKFVEKAKIQEEAFQKTLQEMVVKNEKLGEQVKSSKQKNKKTMEEQKEDFISMVKELQHQKETEKKLRERNKKLEYEIELAEHNMQRMMKAQKMGGKNTDKVFMSIVKPNSSNSNSSGKTGKSSKSKRSKAKTNYTTGKESEYSTSRKYSENMTNISSHKDSSKKASSKANKIHKIYDEEDEIYVKENPFDKEIDLTDLRVSASNKFVASNTFYKNTRNASGKSHQSVVSSMSTSTYHMLVNDNAVSSGYGKKKQPSKVRVLSSSKSRSNSGSKEKDTGITNINTITKNNTKENGKITAKEIFKDCDHREDVEGGIAKINKMLKSK